ncbi:MAG: hypothetical protein U0736_02550 [Gemmataceae bacterium]
MWDKSVDPAAIDRVRSTKDAGQKHTYLDILQHRRAGRRCRCWSS